MVHHNEHDAQALHEVNVGYALLGHYGTGIDRKW